jgi:L,D-transpeptidase ErfK/SrfK
MKSVLKLLALAVLTAFMVTMLGCTTEPVRNINQSATTSPSPSPTVAVKIETALAPVTLPVLNALFSDEAFKSELKSKANLTDDQINSLQKSANDEIARLRQSNAEQQSGSASEARERATEAIRNAVGEQKAQAILSLVNEHWVKGSEELEASNAPPGEVTMLPGPNAVPKDSRIVVNIPAFRMDLFRDGSLVKSYKIGIGYPEFPLPTGLRKAQQIIFNPTWTPPDEPWVAKMKNVTVGEKIEAGSKLNPLGPIKIPIGMPSLIHGGKSPAKLGNFASHGCVGLTNAQVKDFARLLAQAAGTQISEKAIETYLKDSSKTKVVKLDKSVPVELRYETIVVEDGKLHIYKDVYDQDSNTEENLQAVLGANGLKLEDLSEAERAEVLEALNAMSSHPKKLPPANVNRNTNVSSSNSTQSKSFEKKTRFEKKPAKNSKERVVEIAALRGKGYPAPVDLDSGTGKPGARAATASASP